MLEGIKTLITNSNLLFLILLFSNIKCDSDSSNSETKDDKRDDYKRWTPSAEYWLNNHKPYYNYVYAKSRESKSNNEPYFTEPNNNDGYDNMQPSTIQITAIPGGLGAGPLAGPIFPGQIPGLTTGTDVLNPLNPYLNPLNTLQKFPVFVINKSKSDVSSHFKWLLPILLLLGAPLLFGLICIPIILQSIFFFMTIVRNLGILLPLLPAITGITGLGNAVNPIIPTTG